MVILKSLKKQINQFITPEIEPIGREFPSIEKSKSQKKSPYSHGLEEIYTLENVDPKTIRTFGEEPEEEKIEQKNEGKEVKEYTLPDILQYQFNFGGVYQQTLPSFLLQVPLFAVGLSDNAVKALRKEGLYYVKDVVDVPWNDLIQEKGIGQGHIEELKKQLGEFLGNKELIDCQEVNYRALLLSLVQEEEQSKQYCYLEQFGLQSLIKKTATMRVELKRLIDEEKQSWIREGAALFQTVDRVGLLRTNIRSLLDTFVIPWLGNKGGFALDYEICDRLEQVAEDPSFFYSTWSFISTTYFPHESILSQFLPSLDKRVFFANVQEFDRFQMIEEKALTYFYQDELIYPLKDLVFWISRELASSWKSIERDYLQKVISYSSSFYVRKNDKGQLLVYLA